jgi:glycosyltransferase involved in cell wall biosynthesis
MKISVVIATYNRADLLRRTLDVLQRQAFQPGDEVIVVDNGSTDATPDVIASAAQRFAIPLRHFRETTPGKTPAMNAGIAVARGDILALTDDDVFPAPDWIATMHRLFEGSSMDLVGGRIDPRWEQPAPSWLQIEQQHGYGPMASPLALLHYGDVQPLGGRTALGANMAIRRSVLRSLGGFSLHLGRHRGTLLCGEDHDLCQRAVAAGFRCEYHPELRVEHWVPADRTRLRYFLRWFFWSGITDAMLRSTDPGRHGTVAGTVRHYLFRRLLTAPAIALWSALRGRRSETAASAIDAAFALGYIAQRIGIRRFVKFYPGRSGTTNPAEATRLDRKDARSEPYGVIG